MIKSEIVIELKNLSKVYGVGHTEVKALDNVSLHVEKGEIVLIMGPSGAGKTTLLQIIGALLRPTNGDVFINSELLSNLSSRELSKLRLNTFGFIYQSHNLLGALNAVKNVQIVLNLAGIKGKKSKDAASNSLIGLGLGHRLSHKPSKLSGGEQQRVAIARALANNPSIILADEPTANLDSKTGYEVVNILRRVAKESETTVVVVTHDTRIKNLADRILWLEDGKLKVEWSSKGVVVDPVCLMVVDPLTTKYVSDHGGKKFYFCMEQCKHEFERDPERFEYGIHA
jgi:putative ABC transport system ATP-binding protein